MLRDMAESCKSSVLNQHSWHGSFHKLMLDLMGSFEYPSSGEQIEVSHHARSSNSLRLLLRSNDDERFHTRKNHCGHGLPADRHPIASPS